MFGETWLGLNDIEVEGNLVWEKDASVATWTEWVTAPNSANDDCTKMKTGFDWDMKGCTENRQFACQNGTGLLIIF